MSTCAVDACVQRARPFPSPPRSQERATAESAKTAALDALVQQCNMLGVPQPALAKQARFALWECDHVNNVTAAAVRGSRKLKVGARAGGRTGKRAAPTRDKERAALVGGTRHQCHCRQGGNLLLTSRSR